MADDLEQSVKAEAAEPAQAKTAEDGAEATAVEPARNPNFKWYILHAYSGFERKVRESIESRVQAFGLKAEWQRVMQTTPWTGKEYVKAGDDYPATYVNWNDAMTFCAKLTAQERRAGRLPSDWQYTLPTEAQWEYACRAGTTTPFSFGNDDSQLGDFAWWGGIYGDGNAKSEQFAHKVGQKKLNPWGFSDIHGNVWEWCRDWYGEELAGGTDPPGPSRGSVRVFRGGSWFYPARDCRSALRSWLPPGNRLSCLGFRLAAVPSGR